MNTSCYLAEGGVCGWVAEAGHEPDRGGAGQEGIQEQRRATKPESRRGSQRITMGKLFIVEKF